MAVYKLKGTHPNAVKPFPQDRPMLVFQPGESHEVPEGLSDRLERDSRFQKQENSGEGIPSDTTNPFTQGEGENGSDEGNE